MTTGNLDATKYNAMVANAAARVTISSTVFKDFIGDVKDKLESNYAEAHADNQSAIGLNRQALINGNFDVWQRGTSFDVASNAYTADRWKCTIAGAIYNVSCQSISDLDGTNCCVRITYKTLGSNDVYLSYGFEFDTFKKLKGKKATISFYARKSGTVLAFVASLRYTTSESNVNNGNSIGFLNLATDLTGGWVKYSLTVDMPLISDTNQGLQLVFQCPSTNINDYIEIAQVQVNAGDTALPFQPRSFADELALCRRYLFRFDSTENPFSPFGIGQGETATTAFVPIMFPNKMRVPPTLVSSAANTFQLTGFVLVALSVDRSTSYGVLLLATSSSGLAAGTVFRFTSANTITAFLNFDAEL